jgi:Fe-S cluster assembly scaffold protein SufB
VPEQSFVIDSAEALSITVDDRSSNDVLVWLKGNPGTHSIEVTVGREAQCSITTINAIDAEASIVIKQHGTVGEGSTLNWRNVTLGGKSVEHELVSHVKGNESESSVDWMCYAKGTEKQLLNVRNIFDGLNGRGEVLMRGIAEQKGHTVCKGLIDIGLHGGGTNTYLTQEVLMLDASSKVDAVPSLEIKTNDVKASHSATVARVTEEDLFYFGARGIAPHEARRMFVLGFLGDITQRIAQEKVREDVIAAIEAKYAA